MLGIFQHSNQSENALFDGAVAEGIVSYLVPCKGQIDLSSVRALRSLVRSTEKLTVRHFRINPLHGSQKGCSVAFGVPVNEADVLARIPHPLGECYGGSSFPGSSESGEDSDDLRFHDLSFEKEKKE